MKRRIGLILILSVLTFGCSATMAPSVRIATEYPNACNDSTMLGLAKRPVATLTDREFEYLMRRSSDCSNLRAAAMVGEATVAGANAQADTMMTIANVAMLFGLIGLVAGAATFVGK